MIQITPVRRPLSVASPGSPLQGEAQVKFLRVLGAGVLCAVLAPQTLAQGYPIKPVHVIVPQPPGGVDTVARVIVQKLSEGMGQPFVVENRPGASGTIGTSYVAKSAADGYTLLINASIHVINSFILRNLPFDPLRDFTPITEIGSSPLVIAVHASVPANDLTELLALSRRQKLNWAIPGFGSADHLTAEALKLNLGIALQTVPYKGMGPAITDLAGGQVHAMGMPILPALPHIKSGRIRALAVTGARRNKGLPEVKTVAESGMPGFEMSTWYGIWGPKGLPNEIAARIQAETAKAIRSAEVRDKLPDTIFDLKASGPEEFARFIELEAAKYAGIVKQAKISAE